MLDSENYIVWRRINHRLDRLNGRSISINDEGDLLSEKNKELVYNKVLN